MQIVLHGKCRRCTMHLHLTVRLAVHVFGLGAQKRRGFFCSEHAQQLGVQVSCPTDVGEGLAKRKSAFARRSLQEVCCKDST